MIRALALCLLAACASSPRADTHADATRPDAAVTVEAPAPPVDASSPPPAPPVTVVEAGAPSKTASPKLKVVTIGMHVAGGPFDEPTKEPFKKAVEPHFPEMASCWANQVPHPPKQADVGVDLLIEPTGGPPKVSNPRSTLGKDGEVEGFVPCVIAVFESVTFPRLVDRGRTGVSYSLRFTQ